MFEYYLRIYFAGKEMETFTIQLPDDFPAIDFAYAKAKERSAVKEFRCFELFQIKDRRLRKIL